MVCKLVTLCGMSATTFELSLEHREGFEFEVRFDGTDLPPMIVDEPEPLGHLKGPNPTRILGTAIGNCLSASLLFCVSKAKLEVRSMHTQVRGTVERNEQNRLRIKQFDVTITIDVAGADPERAARCLNIFEDFCTVTASVRRGILVQIKVQSPKGYVFLESDGAEHLAK